LFWFFDMSKEGICLNSSTKPLLNQSMEDILYLDIETDKKGTP